MECLSALHWLTGGSFSISLHLLLRPLFLPYPPDFPGGRFTSTTDLELAVRGTGQSNAPRKHSLGGLCLTDSKTRVPSHAASALLLTILPGSNRSMEKVRSPLPRLHTKTRCKLNAQHAWLGTPTRSLRLPHGSSCTEPRLLILVFLWEGSWTPPGGRKLKQHTPPTTRTAVLQLRFSPPQHAATPPTTRRSCGHCCTASLSQRAPFCRHLRPGRYRAPTTAQNYSPQSR